MSQLKERVWGCAKSAHFDLQYPPFSTHFGLQHPPFFNPRVLLYGGSVTPKDATQYSIFNDEVVRNYAKQVWGPRAKQW